MIMVIKIGSVVEPVKESIPSSSDPTDGRLQFHAINIKLKTLMQPFPLHQSTVIYSPSSDRATQSSPPRQVSSSPCSSGLLLDCLHRAFSSAPPRSPPSATSVGLLLPTSHPRLLPALQHSSSSQTTRPSPTEI